MLSKVLHKKIFPIIIISGLTLDIGSYIFYHKNKTELFQAYQTYTTIKQKLVTIKNLQDKYKTKINKQLLSKYCNISSNTKFINLQCNNLNQKDFNILSYEIFNKNLKLESFDILNNDKTLNFNIKIAK